MHRLARRQLTRLAPPPRTSQHRLRLTSTTSYKSPARGVASICTTAASTARTTAVIVQRPATCSCGISAGSALRHPPGSPDGVRTRMGAERGKCTQYADVYKPPSLTHRDFQTSLLSGFLHGLRGHGEPQSSDADAVVGQGRLPTLYKARIGWSDYRWYRPGSAAREDATLMQITWREPERQPRADALKTPSAARLRPRCQAVLMAYRGRQHRHIAEELGVTGRPLPRGRRASQEARLAGRTRRWRPGPLWRWPRRGPASMAARSVRVRGGLSGRAMACAPTARPRALSTPLRRSRPSPAGTARPSPQGGRGSPRLAAPR
jgi:hypothetical protein